MEEKKSGYKTSASKPESIARWKELQPVIEECQRAGFSLNEFFEYMEWESREPWYRIKPIGYNWIQQQKKLLESPPKKEQRDKKQMFREKKKEKKKFHNLRDLQDKQKEKDRIIKEAEQEAQALEKERQLKEIAKTKALRLEMEARDLERKERLLNEEKAYTKAERDRERQSILRKFGVKNLKQLGCRNLEEFHAKKLSPPVTYSKKPETESTNQVTITGIALKPGTAMVVMCRTNEISTVIKEIRKGVEK
jgi:hypothetical protein